MFDKATQTNEKAQELFTFPALAAQQIQAEDGDMKLEAVISEGDDSKF